MSTAKCASLADGTIVGEFSEVGKCFGYHPRCSAKEANMPGIHHVTAISGDPVKNLRFYTRDLGLRFVKKTVNFDDPSTYHFYFGDETGHPGTILTFFPWMNATAGQRGVGEASQTAFRVPLSSIGYWTDRFFEKGISYQKPEKTFR
jgi:glyoxalase family protein